jgi:hypothetical protein
MNKEKDIEACKELVRINPDDAEAHYNLARSYASLNDKDAALKQCRILKKLNYVRAIDLLIKLCEIPKVASIPDYLYKKLPLEKVFRILGFEENQLSGLEKEYGNSVSSFTPKAYNTGLQWVITITFSNPDKENSVICPDEFGICPELTPIELLSLLYRKWVSTFGEESTPSDLLFGKTYLEHIKMLKKSRLKKPYIRVDREAFRFFINKIKNEIDFNTEDCEMEFSYINEQLKISVKSTVVFVPAPFCQNVTSEKIYLSARDFYKSIAKRFTGDTVYLRMEPNGLWVDSRIVRARWDGPDLWEYYKYYKYDEYDEVLSIRTAQWSSAFINM